MRSPYVPRTQRKILCVYPRYASSFGTFEHSYKLFPGVHAFMPPQGLLLIAAYLPASWEVRFIDENERSASEAELAWADAVLISAMHVQRPFVEALNARAQRAGALTVLGGPSVSATPADYPDVDILHIGELGDATDRVIAALDESCERQVGQRVFETRARTDLTDFPVPAYQQVDVSRYFLGSVQFSSGCPYQCEFCDIPALYGRSPRLKSPDQICKELDAIVEAGAKGAVYFVDDNFIGNKKAARELLPRLVRWQESNGFPLRFACEATLNLAQLDPVLETMREALFHTVFVGIETPEADALSAMRKKQNLMVPLLESVDKLNSYGLEVVSGIIMGLDTDTADTGRNILSFIEASKIPLLTINLLYALPKTPLYERLARDGRLYDSAEAARRASNVRFRMDEEAVLQMWFDTVTRAYEPQALFDRFRHQTERTFPNRRAVQPKPSLALVNYGLQIMARVMWHCGLRAPWRRAFWDLCWPLLRQGRIDEVLHIGIVCNHLLEFTRRIEAGEWEPSFYAESGKSSRQAKLRSHAA